MVRLDHSVVHVSDRARSDAFYRDVLGAEVLREGAPTFEAMLFATVSGRRRIRPCWEGRR